MDDLGVRLFFGNIQISLRWAAFKAADEPLEFEAKESNDVSTVEYELVETWLTRPIWLVDWLKLLQVGIIAVLVCKQLPQSWLFRPGNVEMYWCHLYYELYDTLYVYLTKMFTAYCQKNFSTPEMSSWPLRNREVIRAMICEKSTTSLPALLLVVPAKQCRKVFSNSVVVGPQILSQGVDLVKSTAVNINEEEESFVWSLCWVKV